ncbi:DNA/RNA non-specific endonuclease [Arthrobacter mobilis]|uniref:Serine protease n=1 Tax=Arthrobacter mobilis TaxID=2724944 RepID=A0A7X6K2X9_9MICC|nr:DNA/RNA non-specific endonuclease [Arthrobacter mobilis]NKX53692.1 endonuclease [Arthrobacter mobilis]
MIVPQDVIEATEARYRQHAGERQATEEKIKEAGEHRRSILDVDDPARVVLRSRRIMRDPAVREAIAAASAGRLPGLPPEAAAGAEDGLLERLIGGNNFLGVSFLETGVRAARTVGRIHVRDSFGGRGFGTGFMVSPRLLLTNNHVLPDAGTAASSRLEFNYQIGEDGLARTAYLFGLEPQVLFLTDAGLDFSLVAVAAAGRSGNGGPAALDDFGFNRTSGEQGKILLGESINIIQHPEGRPKQLALQQNELVDRLENFLHYHTDTSPGSSGSPLYNNQWEIVGLHHSGVPDRNDNGDILAVDGTVWTPEQGEMRIRWKANEGVRISSILHWLDRASGGLEAAQRQLLAEVLDPAPLPPGEQVPVSGHDPAPQQAAAAVVGTGGDGTDGVVRITVPLEISIRLGAAAGAAAAGGAAPGSVSAEEAISIDPDYSKRQGYDEQFLAAPVPLPVLSAAQRANAAQNRQAGPGQDPAVLPYHHFSLVVERSRRLAWYTAVNIDGALSRTLRRDRDVWFFDPRLGRDEQVGNELYSRNDFDRGHLVRRLDPAWGPDEQTAKVANDDTFHFTNSSPQHKFFNQDESLWAGLEDFLLENARAARQRISVFTGPVFAAADPVYRGVPIPLAFWKIAVFDRPDGGQSATAYLISQRKLVEGILTEAFVPETFQVPVRKVSELTGLDFAGLFALDPLNDRFEEAPGSLESLGTGIPGRQLRSYADLQL